MKRRTQKPSAGEPCTVRAVCGYEASDGRTFPLYALRVGRTKKAEQRGSPSQSRKATWAVFRSDVSEQIRDGDPRPVQPRSTANGCPPRATTERPGRIWKDYSRRTADISRRFDSCPQKLSSGGAFRPGNRAAGRLTEALLVCTLLWGFFIFLMPNRFRKVYKTKNRHLSFSAIFGRRQSCCSGFDSGHTELSPISKRKPLRTAGRVNFRPFFFDERRENIEKVWGKECPCTLSKYTAFLFRSGTSVNRSPAASHARHGGKAARRAPRLKAQCGSGYAVSVRVGRLRTRRPISASAAGRRQSRRPAA